MTNQLTKQRLWIGCVAIACLAWTARADEPSINSPADLWQGYDATALPLEIESIKKWQENDCTFEKLRFTAEEVDGVKVRVFAITGLPAIAGSRPGILHIHGGGQTASFEWVKYWTQRGYACVTFDFCGPWADRKEVTDWGPLKQGNMAEAAGGLQVTPTPRASSWYHWTIAARRALTLLEQQPEVDPGRLGIFGISMGGTLCWSVAGSDARVKTAVPIYGSGYNQDGRRTRWGYPMLTPELALFQRVVSPEAHAPYITVPILFLNSTNDFHGWMDSSYDTLSATAGRRWQAFTPRQNHHIAPDEGRDLPAWMDYQLKGGPPFPTSPTLTLGLSSEGIPLATVNVGSEEIERIDVWYSLSDKAPPNRFWRQLPASRRGILWQAEVPVVDTWQPLFAFANVHYANGICLTTNLERRVPGTLGKARATLRATDQLNLRVVAGSWFYARSYTDPMVEKTFVRVLDTPERLATVSVNPDMFGDMISVDLSSHVLGDPQFVSPEGPALAFDWTGEIVGEGLRVTLTEKEWTPQAQIYTAVISPTEMPAAWTTTVLQLDRFKSKDGDKSPTRWQDLDKINLQCMTPKPRPFQFANLRWRKVEAESPP